MCSRCNFNFTYSYDLEIRFISKYKFSDLYGRYVYEKKYSYLTLLIYNIIPIINAIFPNSINYTFLTDLWIINSLYALISSVVMSKKYGFNIWIILLISILFVPTMLIFYNTSALIFMIAYLVLALIGSLIGRFIYIKKNK